MIIALSNQKGGCGKTTTAINMAAAFANLGKRTLLIDLDPQGHAGYGLGLKSEQVELSMYNALTERADRRRFLDSFIQPLYQNLDIAPSHILLSTIEQECADKEQAVNRLKSALEYLTFPYEMIIVDCPPSLGFLTFNALCACDLIIVPVDLGAFSLMGVMKLLSMVELIRVKMKHVPEVYALATMVDLRSHFANKMIQEVKEAFKDHIFENFIHMNVATREAQALGVPVRMHEPWVKASKDYDNLAKEIMESFDITMSFTPLLTSDSNGRRVTVYDFSMNAPEAKGVYVVGDFNNWTVNDDSKCLSVGRGEWQRRLALTPGRYHYRFVIDGKWTNDPTNQQAEPNPFGGVDSILEIG